MPFGYIILTIWYIRGFNMPTKKTATAKPKVAAKKAAASGVVAHENDAIFGTISVKKPGKGMQSFKLQAQKRAMVHSPARYLGIKPGKHATRLVALVNKGLGTDSVDALAGHLELATSEFTKKFVHIPTQTFRRRKEAGRLNSDESDRVVRYARLLKLTTDMMEGDEESALRWLKTPHHLLGGETPLTYANTETGASEVTQLVGRIEHGVIS